MNILDFRRKKKIQAFKDILNSEAGSIFLEELMKLGYMNQTTFTAGDVNTMLVKEGKRLLVLEILRILNMSDKEAKEIVNKFKPNGEV